MAELEWNRQQQRCRRGKTVFLDERVAGQKGKKKRPDQLCRSKPPRWSRRLVAQESKKSLKAKTPSSKAVKQRVSEKKRGENGGKGGASSSFSPFIHPSVRQSHQHRKAVRETIVDRVFLVRDLLWLLPVVLLWSGRFDQPMPSAGPRYRGEPTLCSFLQFLMRAFPPTADFLPSSLSCSMT